MYLFFDVETRGLYGEAFAVGYVVTTDNGSVVLEGIHCCPMNNVWDNSLSPNPDGWMADNVLPHLPAPDCFSTFAVREKFLQLVGSVVRSAEKMGEKTRIVADVCFPCETEFLRQCASNLLVTEETDQLFSLMPYPLLDLSTFLLAKGHDPVGTYKRRENELPAHNPLFDARQTARIWFQLMRNEPVA